MGLLPPGVHEEFPLERDQLTPLFKQYTEIKRQQPEALLFYRLGDFYEMFGPDAVRAAGILGLTLTARSCYTDYKVAMCGVPHHASTKYIKQLVEAGEVVAICEQTEDASLAKGLVARAVTRVITAGTLIEDEYLSGDQSNFLAVIASRGKQLSAALLESSGGRVDLFETGADQPRELFETVMRQSPAELLVPADLGYDAELAAAQRPGQGPAIHRYDALPGEADVRYFLERYFHANSLDAFGIGTAPAAQAALFALIRYLKETFKVGAVSLYPRLMPLAGYLFLDSRTVAHLELTESAAPGSKGTNLFDLINRCLTACGKRELKRWLLQPLAVAEQIRQRHDTIEYLINDDETAGGLAELLERIQDIERIVHRIGLRRTNPKEVRALADSLEPLTLLGSQLGGLHMPLLSGLAAEIGDFSELFDTINGQLSDEPPLKISDGAVVRPGADTEVDELRSLMGGNREWFAAYEQAQRERSGIRTLRVKHTDAFGYFIEVSKANLALVPEDYTRKQTLVNSERFVTEELAECEEKARHAESKLSARERELFELICTAIDAQQSQLSRAARAVAAADCLLSLTKAAAEHSWTRPEFVNSGSDESVEISVEGGRHPLVEKAVGKRYYTKNDCYLSQANQQISLVTGPNMGGKSTYLRMVAVIAVLSQTGSFVPAGQAQLPVLERIYTRIGAQDYLALGQSTFMVEMVETAEILNTCGSRSLILLDEVGRGTSTYDGISIAKSVVEYLHEHPARPLVLFATHFFELTDLSQLLSRVKNLQVEVAKDRDRFVFLYKVKPGAASESFGIEVAALAGLPEQVVTRAREILVELDEVKSEALRRAKKIVQLGLFGKD